MDYKEYAISAMLAKFAYSNQDTLGDLWFKMRNSKRYNMSNVFKDVREVPEFYFKDEIQAFSIVKEFSLIFVFRGAEDIIDIGSKRVPYFQSEDSNLNISPGNILVHAEFLRQFLSIKDAMVKTIEKYSGKIEKILCIGHSFGGALATLASGYFGSMYNGKTPVTCHTFGSPRVGNVAYAEWYSRQVTRHVRIINEKDQGCQVPFGPGFQHCSEALCVKEDLTVRTVEDTKWYWRLLHFKGCCNLLLGDTCDQYIEAMVKMYKNRTLELRIEV